MEIPPQTADDRNARPIVPFGSCTKPIAYSSRPDAAFSEAARLLRDLRGGHNCQDILKITPQHTAADNAAVFAILLHMAARSRYN
jgi:hypothetical protein